MDESNIRKLSDAEETILANMVVAGILLFELNEEELVDRLSSTDNTDISLSMLKKIEQLLAGKEEYELANVVKTHIEYNYKE